MILPTYSSGDSAPTPPEARWTSSSAGLDAGGSLVAVLELSEPASGPLSVSVLQSSLPAGATVTLPGTGAGASFTAGQSQVSVVIEGSASLVDGSFTLTLQAGAGYTLGMPQVFTVTTTAASAGAAGDVGSGWTGGIPGVARHTRSYAFQPVDGQPIQPNYAVNSERCQVDIMSDNGSRKNAMVTGFGDDTATYASVVNPAPAPAENGVYDRADPWQGVQLRLTGLVNINGVTEAVADLSAPEREVKTFGLGAKGHSGADLVRQDYRTVPFLTGNSGKAGRPATALIAATNRVDLPCVVYELMLTNSTIGSADNPCGIAADAVGRVDFDELILDVPAGYTILMLDAYSGSGGSDAANGKIIKSFDGANEYHAISPGELPGWTIAVYDPIGCTEAQAQAILEGQDCGAIIDGPRKMFREAATGHAFLDWRRGPSPHTKTEVDARAQRYRDQLRTGLLTGGVNGGLFTSDRVGKHVACGRSTNGGSSGQGIHFRNFWNMASPNEMSGSRYWVECMSRRISEATIYKDEARPIFGGDFVVEAVDPQSTQSPPITKEWTLCGNANSKDGWEHQVPAFTLPGISGNDVNHAGFMDYAGFQDDTRSFPTAPSGMRESVLLRRTGEHWGHLTSHQHRFSIGREAWIYGRSFLGYMMFMNIASLAERYVGAREPAFNSIGATGFYNCVFISSSQMNSGRIVASIAERPKLPGGRFDLIARDGTGTTLYATGSSAFNQDQFTGRIMAVPAMHIADAYAIARTQELRDKIHPPAPTAGTPIEQDYSSIRQFLRAEGWMTNDYGMMSFYDRGGDPSDPYGFTASNPSNGTAVHQRLRNFQERRGYLAGGENLGIANPSQAIPDSIQRWNYDENPADDDQWHQNYNVWQHTYHSVATNAMVEILIADGVSVADPLISDALPVGACTLYCMLAAEGHPAATSNYVPMPRYAPCSAGTQGRDDPTLTKAQFLSGLGSWWYTAGNSDFHYFSPALANNAFMIDLYEFSGEDVLRIVKKLLVVGDQSNTNALIAWADRIWDLANDDGAQHHRNEAGLLAWAYDALSV